MQTIQWKMEEVFYFPGHIGTPKETKSINVKAGFTEKRSDEAVRLSGIYHIAARIQFSEEEEKKEPPSKAIFIDDVELQEGIGYFEYAIPLHIDLPPEVQKPFHVHAKAVQAQTEDGVLRVTWEVDCVYTNPVPALHVAEENEISEKHEEKHQIVEEINEKVVKARQEESQNVTQHVQPSKEEQETVVDHTHNDQEHQLQENREKPIQELKEENIELDQTVEMDSYVATYDSSSFNEKEDMLSYIATLPDEWSTTTFRSNNVLV